MRLKVFVGSSMTDVMAQVRRELGDEAIIVSSLSEAGGNVRVTAALETSDVEPPVAAPEPAAAPAAPTDGVRRLLVFHGVPQKLADRLTREAEARGEAEREAALAAALGATFRFLPVDDDALDRPVLLVGPNGSGKTVTAVKLAARQALAGRPVTIISTDTVRAGGTDQLAVLAGILGADYIAADSPEGLEAAVAACPAERRVFVDSAGIGPFNGREQAALGEHADAAGAETMLVIGAGMDPVEAGDAAAAFGALRPSRLLVTRVDAVRRLGAVLTAADGAGLALGEIGITPHIADGLTPLDAATLARLLCRDPNRLHRNQGHTEAAE